MSKKRKKSTNKKPRRRMDGAAVEEVRVWFGRILINANRAVSLASQMSIHDLTESNPLFWALAKYAENVEESITQLDNINKNILLCLVEIPDKSVIEGDTAWSDLKGMRAKLAHQFWNIDPGILWDTVVDDFPKLIALLPTLKIVPVPLDVDAGQMPGIEFRGSALIDLGMSTGRFPPQPGESLLCLWFDPRGEPYVLRIARKGEKTLTVHSSHPSLVIDRFEKKEDDGWRSV